MISTNNYYNTTSGDITNGINKTNKITTVFVIYDDMFLHTHTEYYYIYGTYFILIVLLIKNRIKQSLINELGNKSYMLL